MKGRLKMDRKERILRCLEENGIELDRDGNLVDVESIGFIAAILDIENEFDIEIPNDYLLIDVLSNLTQFDAVVESQIKKTFGKKG